MTHYVALLHKDSDGGYGIAFPDFPGCISAGDTVDDAIRNGAEALGSHVELMAEAGEAVPPPRAYEQIKAANEDWYGLDDATIAMVPLIPAEGRSVRINITIDEHLLSRIDAATSNRSAFLASAARAILDRGAVPSDHRESAASPVAALLTGGGTFVSVKRRGAADERTDDAAAYQWVKMMNDLEILINQYPAPEGRVNIISMGTPFSATAVARRSRDQVTSQPAKHRSK